MSICIILASLGMTPNILCINQITQCFATVSGFVLFLFVPQLQQNVAGMFMLLKHEGLMSVSVTTQGAAKSLLN